MAVNASAVIDASLDAIDALDWEQDDVTGVVRINSLLTSLRKTSVRFCLKLLICFLC